MSSRIKGIIGIKVELDLSNYATKANLNGATGIDTSTLASKKDLASLKTTVVDLDVEKLKIVPTDYSKISNVVDNDVVEKTVYDKVVIKVNATDNKIANSSGLVTKTQMVNANTVLVRRLKMLMKRYLILMRWSKRLITTQKLQKLKTRYLVLLD